MFLTLLTPAVCFYKNVNWLALFLTSVSFKSVFFFISLDTILNNNY